MGGLRPVSSSRLKAKSATCVCQAPRRAVAPQGRFGGWAEGRGQKAEADFAGRCCLVSYLASWLGR